MNLIYSYHCRLPHLPATENDVWGFLFFFFFLLWELKGSFPSSGSLSHSPSLPQSGVNLFLVWRRLGLPLAIKYNILFMHIMNSPLLRAYASRTEKPESLEKLFLFSGTYLEEVKDSTCSNKGKRIGGGKLHSKYIKCRTATITCLTK